MSRSVQTGKHNALIHPGGWEETLFFFQVESTTGITRVFLLKYAKYVCFGFFSFLRSDLRINECLCVNEGILIRKNTNLLGLCAMKLLPLLCADCHGMSNRWHQCKLVTSPFWRQRSYVNIMEFKSCSELIPFFAINAKTNLLVIVNETDHLDNSFGSCFQGMLLLQMCEVILKGALQDSDSTVGRTCVL